MSKRSRRLEIDDLDSAPVEEVQTESEREEPAEVVQPMLPFAHWFDKMLKLGKVRHYQDEAILVFFKKQGLRNTEMEDTYNKMFKNF